MGSSRRRRARLLGACLILLPLRAPAGAGQPDDRLAQLERRAAELEQQGKQLAQRSQNARAEMAASERAIAQIRTALASRDDAAQRAALERKLTAARDQALALRALEDDMKKVDDLRRSVDRERAALYDAEIDRLDAELERSGPRSDRAVLKKRFAHLAELHRLRDSIANAFATSTVRRVTDLDAINVGPGDTLETLLEKVDLVESFARGWRAQREQVLRRLAQARVELDLVRRLTAIMEQRRRGRLTSPDPFAADVEAFTLRNQELEIASTITAMERQSKELAGWIERAKQRQGELGEAAAPRTRP